MFCNYSTKICLPLPALYLLSIAFIFSSTILRASTNENNPEYLFQQAQLLYQSSQYELALPFFEKAVQLSPMESSYHHMLGKCYGRIAEEGSWLTALRNARKTLMEFKIAVELDDSNIQALRDLEEFYRRAPGFLGGSKVKAKKISKILSNLELDKKLENSLPAVP